MKKLFIVMAVASLGFVACNNEGTTESTGDTTSTTTDTTVKVSTDTTVVTTDTTAAKADTTAKADTLRK